MALQMTGHRPRQKHRQQGVVGLILLGLAATCGQPLVHAGPVINGALQRPRLERSSFNSSNTGIPTHSSHGMRSHHGLNSLAPAKGNTFVGKCVGVLDGDTIYIDHDGQIEKADLWGIDCPELGQPYGLQARQYTTSRVLNQPVRVHVKGRTSSGRLLGWIDTVGGSTLNEDLVANGLAWWTKKVAKDEILLPLLEDTARQDKRGLWADKDPISPSKWRKMHGE